MQVVWCTGGKQLWWSQSKAVQQRKNTTSTASHPALPMLYGYMYNGPTIKPWCGGSRSYKNLCYHHLLSWDGKWLMDSSFQNFNRCHQFHNPATTLSPVNVWVVVYPLHVPAGKASLYVLQLANVQILALRSAWISVTRKMLYYFCRQNKVE